MDNVLIFSIIIFFVRVLDVSLGTFRAVMTIKGKSLLASTVGFFEVTVWFLLVKEAINTDSPSPWIVIAYAAGFAFGTYIGGLLSRVLVKGSSSVQVITSNKDLANLIRDKGYGVSEVEVRGKDDIKKEMLIIEVKSNTVPKLRKFIKETDEGAFVVVTESRVTANGYIK